LRDGSRRVVTPIITIIVLAVFAVVLLMAWKISEEVKVQKAQESVVLAEMPPPRATPTPPPPPKLNDWPLR
jgi:flagellar basal body-associated protein FliL